MVNNKLHLFSQFKGTYKYLTCGSADLRGIILINICNKSVAILTNIHHLFSHFRFTCRQLRSPEIDKGPLPAEVSS